MNPPQRTLIEKAGNDNGFEHVLASEANGVILASVCHPTRALVGLEHSVYEVFSGNFPYLAAGIAAQLSSDGCGI